MPLKLEYGLYVWSEDNLWPLVLTVVRFGDWTQVLRSWDKCFYPSSNLPGSPGIFFLFLPMFHMCIMHGGFACLGGLCAHSCASVWRPMVDAGNHPYHLSSRKVSHTQSMLARLL